MTEVLNPNLRPMSKFDFLMFIDDDFATNYYHEHIVKNSDVCERYKFYDRAADALEVLEDIKNGQGALPDVIFLDINMPMIDGWMFLEKYAELNIPETPIIVMLSTSLNPKDQERANASSLIHGFSNKPLTKALLQELKAKMIDKVGEAS